MEKYDLTSKEKEGLSYTCAKPFRFEKGHQVKSISSLQERERSNGQTVFEDDLFLISSISKKKNRFLMADYIFPNTETVIFIYWVGFTSIHIHQKFDFIKTRTSQIVTSFAILPFTAPTLYQTEGQPPCLTLTMSQQLINNFF